MSRDTTKIVRGGFHRRNQEETTNQRKCIHEKKEGMREIYPHDIFQDVKLSVSSQPALYNIGTYIILRKVPCVTMTACGLPCVIVVSEIVSTQPVKWCNVGADDSDTRSLHDKGSHSFTDTGARTRTRARTHAQIQHTQHDK